MKKLTAVFLAVIMFASFGIYAFCADFSAPVGGIVIPFKLSDNWHTSTRDDISDELCKKQVLNSEQLNEYMTAFGYDLWLIHKRNDSSVIVKSEGSSKPDYSAMSASALGSEISSQATYLVSAGIFEISKIDKYRSGDVLFVKYTINMEGSLYAVYFETVMDGVFYEIRFYADGALDSATSSDLQSVTDALGAALSSPEKYSRVTTVPAPSASAESGGVDIQLGENSGDGSYNIGGSAVSTTAPQSAADPQQNNDIVEVGTDGETVVVGESFADDDNADGASGIWKTALIVAAVVLIIAAIAAAVAVKKKKSS